MIYARSMTNSEYILGKSIGIVMVFVILNIIMLLLGTGFSFLSNESSKSIWVLLYYPLLISIPTLVYILGLAFFMMILLKNQAITFIVLLGYIALTIFLSQYKILSSIRLHCLPSSNDEFPQFSGFGNTEENYYSPGDLFLFRHWFNFIYYLETSKIASIKKIGFSTHLSSTNQLSNCWCAYIQVPGFKNWWRKIIEQS